MDPAVGRRLTALGLEIPSAGAPFRKSRRTANDADSDPAPQLPPECRSNAASSSRTIIDTSSGVVDIAASPDADFRLGAGKGRGKDAFENKARQGDAQ